MKYVLILAMLFTPVFAADAKPEPQKVFKILTKKGNERWFATAFFISPNRLLTAAHTFKKSADPFIVMGDHEVHCKIIKIDFNKDIALVESDEGCESFYRLVGTMRVIGFPFGRALESPEGKVDSKRIHLHVFFVPGMSGAPLVNEYGDVEGMGVQGDILGDDHDCRAIPASTLADFVK